MSLKSFVDQYNFRSRLFGSPAVDLTEKQDRLRLREAIMSDLSPENLTCDGELSPQVVRQRYVTLTDALRELEELDTGRKL